LGSSGVECGEGDLGVSMVDYRFDVPTCHGARNGGPSQFKVQ
jgi:hypothetical protein